MKRFIKTLLYAVAVLTLAGVGIVAYEAWPRSRELVTDADSIRLPASDAVVRDVVWQPAKPVANLNSRVDEYEAGISSDGGTLLIVRGRPGENADIFVALRHGDGWTEAEPLAAINTPNDELGPVFADDGESIYFYSDRPGGAGGYDLWLSRRGAEGWREPVNLGPAVNSSFDDYGPALTGDGKRLYFASNRPKPDEKIPEAADGWTATLRADRRVRDFDIFVAELTEAGAQQARPVDEINSPADDGAPAVSPYGDFLYFASNCTGGAGGFDIYRSRQLNGRLQSPTGLGPTINTAANELDPRLSLGGYGLFFSSDRRTENDKQTSSGTQSAEKSVASSPPAGESRTSSDAGSTRHDYDLYYSASREVFRETESRPSGFDWAGLWSAMAPNLAWALLTLLLIALLLALMRDFKNRRLSLLARCLFASLLAHLALLLLFNVWQVGSAVATALRGRGETRVSLVSTAIGETITSQIRGNLTEVSTPNIESASNQAAAFQPPPVPVQTDRVDTLKMLIENRLEDRNFTALEPSKALDSALERLAQTPPPQPTVEPETSNQLGRDADSEYSLPESSPAAVTAEPDHPVVPAMADQVTTPSNLLLATSQPADTPEQFSVKRDVAQDVVAADSPSDHATTAPPEDAGLPRVTPEASSSDPVTPVELASAISVHSIEIPVSDVPATDAPEPIGRPTLPSPLASATNLSQRLNFPLHVTQDSVESEITRMPPSTAPSISEQALAVIPNSAAVTDAPMTSPIPAAAVVTDTPSQLAVHHEFTPSDFAMPDTRPSDSLEAAPASAAQWVVTPLTGTQTRPIGLPTPPSQKEPFARTNLSPAESSIHSDALSERSNTSDAAVKKLTPIPVSNQTAVATEIEVSAAAVALAIPSNSDLVGGGVLPPDAVGLIRGRVTRKDSGAPVAGAKVQLVLTEASVEVVSRPAGDYELAVPEVPPFFALTASLPGFVPKSVNVSAAELKRGALIVDFALEPVTDLIIALESQPDVHHLGNDQFEGRINSQFQKSSEGRRLISTFNVSKEQLAAGYSRAWLTMMTRGVQCPHQMRINGRLVRSRMTESPRDGSFGEFSAEFDPRWLLEGENTFKLRAQSCSGDLDDFEFVNVQIHLKP